MSAWRIRILRCIRTHERQSPSQRRSCSRSGAGSRSANRVRALRPLVSRSPESHLAPALRSCRAEARLRPRSLVRPVAGAPPRRPCGAIADTRVDQRIVQRCQSAERHALTETAPRVGLRLLSRRRSPCTRRGPASCSPGSRPACSRCWPGSRASPRLRAGPRPCPPLMITSRWKWRPRASLPVRSRSQLGAEPPWASTASGSTGASAA